MTKAMAQGLLDELSDVERSLRLAKAALLRACGWEYTCALGAQWLWRRRKLQPADEPWIYLPEAQALTYCKEELALFFEAEEGVG